jgi:NTP pyrophosphatase (non-canonical NTP hydrolase)
MSKKPCTTGLSPDQSIEEIQNYIKNVANERGFDQESAQDTLLVMIEECGELAKALRKHCGLKIDHARLESYGNLKHEMADVLICLLSLANKCDINLFDALQEKELINVSRVWKMADSCSLK